MISDLRETCNEKLGQREQAERCLQVQMGLVREGGCVVKEILELLQNVGHQYYEFDS